jgi:undecaprenyl-diphosphatase
MGNPVAGIDHGIALWFHAHVTQAFVSVLRGITEFGSSEWIAIVLSLTVVFFVLKRWWASLIALVVAVPGGMLLNELVKILVHRHRPFEDGWFVDWSGYSFASGHSVGATLLYGQMALFLIPVIKSRRGRVCLFMGASFLIALVGFSRIALGAHYLTDVLGGIFFGMMWLTICLVVLRPFRRVSLPAFISEVVVAEPEPALVPVPVLAEVQASPAKPTNSLL